MNPDQDPPARFPDAALAVTLDAVRRRRTRRARSRAGVALVLLGLSAGAVLYPSAEPQPHPARAVHQAPPPYAAPPDAAPPTTTPPPPVIATFRTAERSASTAGILTIVRTADRATELERIGDDELLARLDGRPHGVFVASDGTRRIWVPGS